MLFVEVDELLKMPLRALVFALDQRLEKLVVSVFRLDEEVGLACPFALSITAKRKRIDSQWPTIFSTMSFETFGA